MLCPGDIVKGQSDAIFARSFPGPVGARGFLGWYIGIDQQRYGLVIASLPHKEFNNHDWLLCMSPQGQLGWFFAAELRRV